MVYIQNTGGHAAHLRAMEVMRNNELPAKEIPEAGFICDSCAKALSAKWPKGHCASYHMGVCSVCNNHPMAPVGVCNVGDWNWPDKKRRGMRD